MTMLYSMDMNIQQAAYQLKKKFLLCSILAGSAGARMAPYQQRWD